MERYETVIIGGGQAGLSVGYYLQKRSRSFVIVDASERIGDSWRQRWDSLKLYSPAFRDGLPGMRFPAKRTAYPTKDEFADYLEAYTESFELPVRSGVSVDALTKEDGKYVVHTGEGGFEADNVVVATGVFKKPYTPDFAGELDPSITQLHSNDYRNLSQLQKGPVLVVGASHSGSDVAWEAASKHDVVLAGKDTGQIPAPIESRRGRLGFRLLFFAGTHILTADTPMGRKMGSHIRHGGAPLLRYRRKDLLRAGVERVLERVVGVKDGMPVLEGGRVSTCGTWSGALDSAPTSAGSGFRTRSVTTAIPCSTRRRCIVSGPLLRRPALPALVRVDAHRWSGARRRARRPAHRRGAGTRARGGARAARAGGRERARRLVTEVVLVWNGLVSESPALRARRHTSCIDIAAPLRSATLRDGSTCRSVPATGDLCEHHARLAAERGRDTVLSGDHLKRRDARQRIPVDAESEPLDLRSHASGRHPPSGPRSP